MPLHPAEELLTPEEAARRLGVTKHTLSNWRKYHKARLPYVRVGRLVKYRAGDLKEFIEANVSNKGGHHG